MTTQGISSGGSDRRSLPDRLLRPPTDGQEPVLFATTVRANIMQGCSGATEEERRRHGWPKWFGPLQQLKRKLL